MAPVYRDYLVKGQRRRVFGGENEAVDDVCGADKARATAFPT